MAAPTPESRADGRVMLRPAECEVDRISSSLPPSSFWFWGGQYPRGMLPETERVDTRCKDLSLHDHNLFVPNRQDRQGRK